jgi:hypothetical protein
LSILYVENVLRSAFSLQKKTTNKFFYTHKILSFENKYKSNFISRLLALDDVCENNCVYTLPKKKIRLSLNYSRPVTQRYDHLYCQSRDKIVSVGVYEIMNILFHTRYFFYWIPQDRMNFRRTKPL